MKKGEQLQLVVRVGHLAQHGLLVGERRPAKVVWWGWGRFAGATGCGERVHATPLSESSASYRRSNGCERNLVHPVGFLSGLGWSHHLQPGD